MRTALQVACAMEIVLVRRNRETFCIRHRRNHQCCEVIDCLMEFASALIRSGYGKTVAHSVNSIFNGWPPLNCTDADTMKRITSLLLGLLILTACGCQCCGVTDHYCDHIDDVADSGPRMEWLYHSKLDLTRINKCDGIQCCPRCR